MRLFVRHPAWTTRKKRDVRPRTSIDLAALLSVLFALVFIVVFGNLYPTHRHELPVDMPVLAQSTPQPAATRDDASIVTVTRDGSVYFRNARVSPDELLTALREAARDNPQKTIYVKADARAKYGDVKAVLDQIRQSGLQNITLLTEQPTP